MESKIESIPTDRLIELIADPQRRTVLDILTETGEPVQMEELAEDIATDTPPPTLGETDDVDRITAQLYHVHLPKLADNSVVDFDPRTGTVRYRSHENVEELLRFIETEME